MQICVYWGTFMCVLCTCVYMAHTCSYARSQVGECWGGLHAGMCVLGCKYVYVCVSMWEVHTYVHAYLHCVPRSEDNVGGICVQVHLCVNYMTSSVAAPVTRAHVSNPKTQQLTKEVGWSPFFDV